MPPPTSQEQCGKHHRCGGIYKCCTGFWLYYSKITSWRCWSKTIRLYLYQRASKTNTPWSPWCSSLSTSSLLQWMADAYITDTWVLFLYPRVKELGWYIILAWWPSDCQWGIIYVFQLAGIVLSFVIGWYKCRFCCKAIWAHVVGGNFQRFKVTDSP